MKKKFYITTPLYYVNAEPHIGHSYTNIVCDTIARYKRLNGFDVFFLTGTDEHGQKVALAAEEAGLAPEDFTNRIVPRFANLWKKLSISYDDFIRTTEKRHIDAVREVLKILLKNGDLYLGKYQGSYCTPCETFWTDTQLKNNLCPDCQRPVEKVSEENYFFKMSRYQAWLLKHIKSHPDFILPSSRRKEILNFLDSPLSDLCISRPIQRLSWGIALPFSKSHVTYVWFDALLNYISAAGFISAPGRFKKLWPADIHMIGKDILRHHAIYWPIMLRALSLKPPKTIFAHGWWKLKDVKMSKSRGNIVDPEAVTASFGTDVFRYFLLREIPFGLDGTYSQKALVGRLNSDLANDLGNLFYRSLTMAEKYFQGVIPKPAHPKPLDKALISSACDLPKKYMSLMERLEFSAALDSVWTLINKANKYIEDAKPWNLVRQKKSDELCTVVYNLVEILRMVAILIYPFIPETSLKMLKQLGLKIDFRSARLKELLKWQRYPVGGRIDKGKPLFPRLI